METRANHVLIGAFTLVVLALAMLFALWIGRATLEREWRWYRVVFDEAVSGLTVGGAVQYNGIQVGEVRELALHPDDPSKVLATIRVGATTPIRTDTTAKLVFTGLTGVSVIQLSGGSPGAPPLLPAPGAEMAEIRAEASAVQKLLASSEDLATAANQILLKVNALLSDENTTRITRTLDHLDQTTGALADSRADIRTLLAEAATASERLNRTLASAEALAGRIDGAVQRLDAGVLAELPPAVVHLRSTLAQLDRLSTDAGRLLDDTRGPLGQFTREGLGQIAPTLDALRRLLLDLNRITDQLERNPREFLLRGQNVPEFQP